MSRTSTASTQTARASATEKSAATPTATPTLPVLDLRGLLDKLKLPDVDVNTLIDSRRKDVEALLAANEQAYRGFEAVTRRQGEMLSEAMAGLQARAKEALATQDATERAARVADHVQLAFGHALSNMREIAELSARSQQQVVDTLGKRLREGITEIGERLKVKA